MKTKKIANRTQTVAPSDKRRVGMDATMSPSPKRIVVLETGGLDRDGRIIRTSKKFPSLRAAGSWLLRSGMLDPSRI